MPPKGKGKALNGWAGDDNGHGIDFHNPRMVAAMKVTGIQPSDLDMETAPMEGSSEMEMRRYEVMDRKRFNLLQELKEAAESLDQRDIDALISGPGRVDEHALFIEEKARIDKQRDRAKEELKRKAAWEVDTQQAVIRSTRERNNMKWRIQELKDEQMRKAEARNEAKRLHVEANVQAARERVAEDRNRIVQKLKEQDDRVKSVLAAKMEDRASRLGTTQEKQDEAARRLDDHLDLEHEARTMKSFNHTKRRTELEAWMDRRKQDSENAQMEGKANFSARNENVFEKLDSQRQERENAARRNLKKIEKAREHSANNFASVAAGCKEKRTQRLEKWKVNQQAKKVETKKRVEELRTEFNTGSERSARLVEKYREATIGRYTGVREIYDTLVSENKGRISRSGDATREHQIDLINFHKAKTESREDQKRQATSYRVEAFRERVAGQTQVEELHELLNLSLRAQSPMLSPSLSRNGARSAASTRNGERVAEILTELGVPIPVQTDAKDEEVEGGQASASGGRGHGEAQGK